MPESRRILALLLVLASFVCCEQSTLLHTYKPVEGNGWNRTDTICFDLPGIEQSGAYYLHIGLRITHAFPYQELMMVAERRMENPVENHLDTIRYRVTNKRGDINQQGVNYYQFENQVLPILLHKGQHGTIRLYHIMHREVIPAVTDVGIRIRQ